jgi:signal transduction histidine kinase
VNKRWDGRIAFAVLGAAVLLLGLWLRNPLVPYGGAGLDASANSPDSTSVADEETARRRALSALERAVQDAQRQLIRLAARALNAPADAEAAFEELRSPGVAQGYGVLLEESGKPFAWAGEFRSLPVNTGTGTNVEFSRFYSTLQVAISRGERTAIASTVLHAEAPADRIAAAVDRSVSIDSRIDGFSLGPLSDVTAGTEIHGADGSPLLRADALALSPGVVQFRQMGRARSIGAIALVILLMFMLAIAWADRRRIGLRIASVAVALSAISLVPWSSFSNTARIFDPAFFYSAAGGPLTANAGVLGITTALLVLAVIALIRSRKARVARPVAWLAAIALAVGGVFAAEIVASGIALPLGGATATLWATWEIPLFLLLLSFFLAAWWFARMALGLRAMVRLTTGARIAFVCGIVAAFIVWTKTTEQRLQLAMRDVAGLEHPDSEPSELLARFGTQLAEYDGPGSRADLLQRYATSDLAASDLQVSLATWGRDSLLSTRLDLAAVPVNEGELDNAVRAAIDSCVIIIHQVVGPGGRQIILAAPHHGGGATTVVATPRTRLIPHDPYASLFGFEEPDKTEAPYTLTLADVTGGGAHAGGMTWRRIENEWHGDQLIATSSGTKRAHVEVDLRSWPTRLVRAALIVMLDIAIAGLLWALAAMPEGAFFRWVRRGMTKWIFSYRGRLTLALFMFFVVPAVGFAIWSYQRLQRDDRSARELLVRDALNSIAADSAGVAEAAATGAPLFLYTNGMLAASSEPLFVDVAPAGRTLPRRVHVNLALHGELGASARQSVADATILWGYRAAGATAGESRVLAQPARSDELVLDRRRRDLTLLVLFATAVGALAAFWLSGFAARILARDLELSRIEVARAERVIAWGEMARQVAHEIKNPLTPIRLGVQHLRRAKSDPRVDFDKVLDDNVARILSEIDRLDKIARTFSRYGTAPGELPPAEKVDVAAILRDVVSLERMGIGGVSWNLAGAEQPVYVDARADELREVLLNVFENARLARAKSVRVELEHNDRTATISVIDDGSGIASAALPRVFEPHFSTRTTGSGLGLAISRRLLESWGGTIDLTSEEGTGARIVITLHAHRS